MANRGAGCSMGCIHGNELVFVYGAGGGSVFGVGRKIAAMPESVRVW